MTSSSELPTPEGESPDGGFGGVIGGIRTAVDTGIVLAIVSPLNESIRVPIIAGSQLIESGPVSGAIAGGASTAIVEGVGALAAADLFSSGAGRQAIDKVNKKVDKLVPEGAQIPKAVEIGLMLIGGSAVSMAVKQREMEDRSFRAYSEYGMKSTAIISGYIASLGAVAGTTVENPSWETAGLSALAVSVVFGAASWTKQRLANSANRLSSP